jgi:CDP-diacylglycerol--serine O-phosphatidyltransferase
MKLLSQLPNALTLTNLTLGTLAIIVLMLGQIQLAIILMGCCLVADLLDGALARKLGAEGELGIQLDSLADVVSFGALPAIMLYTGTTGVKEMTGIQVWVAVISSLVATSAGLRLAKFNIDQKPRKYFHGLATPAGAMLVAGWLWADITDKDFGFGFNDVPWLGIAISLFLIAAYHIPLRLPNLKSPKKGFVTAAFVMITVVIGIFTIGPLSIPLGIILYYLLGLLNLAIKWY